MSFQDDQKKFSEDEFKVYKENMDKEAELKGEELFWGEDLSIYKRPDRQIFNIDVGNLPIEKAEEYINKLKEKIGEGNK